jgi:hypothetical protein
VPKYPSMTAQDKKWQAESDARTLMEADVVLADEKRAEAAKQAAKRLLKEKEVEVEGLKKIATGKVTYSSMPDDKNEE